MSDREAFIAALSAIGPELVSTEPSDLEEIGRDWTRVIPPKPLAIAKPRTREDVVAIARACHASRVAMVPSGGRTGLAGGAVASNGELVVSLTRMSKIDPVDVIPRRFVSRAARR